VIYIVSGLLRIEYSQKYGGEGGKIRVFKFGNYDFL
jgi:hypothetical protein